MSLTELTGKTILVTGASKGIGAAIARRLAAEGAHVIAHYRSDLAGAQAALADASPDRVHLLAADLSVPGHTADLWARACNWRGRVDMLVNNAALMAFDGGVDDPQDVWDAAWNAAWQTNVKSPADLFARGGAAFPGTRRRDRRDDLQLERAAQIDQPRDDARRGRRGRHHGGNQDRRGGSAKENIWRTSPPPAWCAPACPKPLPPERAARLP